MLEIRWQIWDRDSSILLPQEGLLEIAGELSLLQVFLLVLSKSGKSLRRTKILTFQPIRYNSDQIHVWKYIVKGPTLIHGMPAGYGGYCSLWRNWQWEVYMVCIKWGLIYRRLIISLYIFIPILMHPAFKTYHKIYLFIQSGLVEFGRRSTIWSSSRFWKEAKFDHWYLFIRVSSACVTNVLIVI